MRKIAIFGMLLTFSLFGSVITREDIISTASQYVPPINSWAPKVDSTNKVAPTWHSWYKTAKNGGNPPYDKLAYCWSGFDTPYEMKFRTESQSNPVPAGGYNTSQYTYPTTWIAGIDCSGFVLRCWGISTYTSYQQLINYSLQIQTSQLKKGDFLRKTGHSVLYVSGDLTNCNIYESQADPRTGADYPGVIHHTRDITKLGGTYTPYSIFPQFSNPQPADGAENVPLSVDISVEISVNAKYGKINKRGINVKVDDDEVTDFTLTSLGSGEYKVSFHRDFSGLESPEHIVSVREERTVQSERFKVKS